MKLKMRKRKHYKGGANGETGDNEKYNFTCTRTNSAAKVFEPDRVPLIIQKPEVPDAVVNSTPDTELPDTKEPIKELPETEEQIQAGGKKTSRKSKKKSRKSKKKSRKSKKKSRKSKKKSRKSKKKSRKSKKK
jgi:hypothetical protein